MRWRIRLKKQADGTLTRVRVPSEYGDEFTNSPTNSTALEAANWFREHGFPLEKWELSGLVGRFLEGYEFRYYRRWSGNSLLFRRVVEDLDVLVQREEMEMACKAVDAVFSKHLHWVTGSQLNFLLNRNHFNEYVVPAVVKMHPIVRMAGEGSEWSGPRNESFSNKKVW